MNALRRLTRSALERLGIRTHTPTDSAWIHMTEGGWYTPKEHNMNDPRRFRLIRHQDITGVSGVGHVADGVMWPDGTAAIRWRGDRPSTVHWDSIDHAKAVHGHGGATRIEWIDGEDQ